MATAPSPNDLTRQQLDELDALLQRMLSVPLAPPDTPLPAAPRIESAPLPPAWRIDPPGPASAPAPHVALAEPPAPPPLPAPVLKFEAPPPAPLPPPPPAPASKPVTPPALPKPAAKAPPPAPTPRPTVTPPTKALTPAPAAPAMPAPLPLLPLVALNAVFDAACGLLGPPGRLLRSGFFKSVYGWVGLGLLAYTAAHVAQVQGWLALPVALPWPR